VNTGLVNTKSNSAKNRTSITFSATMTATTVTIGGVPRTVVTVTLSNTLRGTGNLRTSTSAVAMVWSPTAAVTSPAGSPSSTAPVTETGAAERDF
jgi:hypothetical protein